MPVDLSPDALRAHLRRTIELAEENARSGQGGPFGALIVGPDGAVVAEAVNRVTPHHDPTAHAEVEALRKAGAALSTHDLEGCILVASCEPCPMCLGASYWARVDAIIFAATRHDAADAGFDDALIYEELPKPPEDRKLTMQHLEGVGAERPFEAWRENVQKIPY